MQQNKWESRDQKINNLIKKNHTQIPVNCKAYSCPQFQGCPQIGSQVSLVQQPQAEVFFLFETMGKHEMMSGLPATSSSGMLFREQFLEPLRASIGRPMPYMITGAVRAFTTSNQEDLRPPTEDELDACWPHLKKELLRHRPKLVVAFGAGAFNALRRIALNRIQLPPKTTGINALRSKSFEVKVTNDYTAKVACVHNPASIIKTPPAMRYFEQDRKFVYEILTGKSGFTQKSEIDKPVIIKKIEVLNTVDDALDFLRMMRSGSLPKNSHVAFDTETYNLNRRFNNDFLSWQFTFNEGEGYLIPINHPQNTLFKDYKTRSLLIKEANLLFNASREESNIDWWVAHNAKFDLSVLHGITGVVIRDVRKAVPWFCTHLGLHWLDENRKALKSFMPGGKPYALKTIGNEFFGFQYKSSALEARSEGALDDLNFDDFVEYSGSDVILTHRLPAKLRQMAREQSKDGEHQFLNFMQFYYWPTIHTISMMECNGMYTSSEHLRYMQGEKSPIWNRVHYLEKEGLQSRPEVLDFREHFKDRLLKGVKGANHRFYEEDLWGTGEAEAAILPTLDVAKKNHRLWFYLEWLKFQPLTFSVKTKEPSYGKSYLTHWASRENFMVAPSMQPYHEFYTNPIGENEKGDVQYEENAFSMIIELSAMKKLGTTYLNALQSFLDDPHGDSVDGRIRAYYQPAGTDTGRLSSNNPNLQNIPSEKKSKAAKEIKNVFQAEPPSRKYKRGTVLIQVDYAGAEVVWAVNFSGEPGLVSFLNDSAKTLERVFHEDDMSDEDFEQLIYSIDFHRRTASLMFDVAVEKVTKIMRQASKSITFGLLYGKTVKGLAADNGWTEEEAQARMDQFFTAFPKLKIWLENQQKIAKERGYVETFMSRRRRLADFYKTGNFRLINEANRKAMNSSIQGQSSDAGMLGVTLVMQEFLRLGKEKTWLIQNMVHDAILVQCPREEVEQVLPIIKRCLTIDMHKYIERHWDCTIPVVLRCDFDIGVRYGDLVEWNQRPKKLPEVLADVDQRALELWGTLEYKEESRDTPRTPIPVQLEAPPAILDLVSEYKG